MGHAAAWIMDVIGPAILLIVLIWLVIKVRSNRDDTAESRRSEEGTREVYREEEQRRREGTDDL
jgi:hypothetical protein